jgi:hypothetical protein
MHFSHHHEIGRQSNSTISVQHGNNFLGNKQPRNECLLKLLGKDGNPGRWKGEFLAHTYRYRTGQELWDQGRFRIPLDLGTTSLGPVMSFMRWRATSHEDYGYTPARP